MKAQKVGVYTSAVALIVTGLVIVLKVNGLASYDVLRYLWPLFIILFGLEVIWRRRTFSDTPMTFSGWSMALIVLFMIFSLAQSVSLAGFAGGWLGSGYLEPVHGQIAVGRDVKQVEITVPDAQVVVTGIASSTVTYDGELAIRASSAAAAKEAIQSRWSVRQSGATILLSLTPDRPETRGWPFWGNHGPYLHVEMPQTLLTHVVTLNGATQVSQMNADSTINTGNGSVTVKQLQGNLVAGTTNGSVSFQNVSGTVKAQTTNGAINGESLVGGDWVCSTVNGAIRLEIPRSAHVAISATTVNGKIGGDASFTGVGKYFIRAQTVNGAVTVDYTD